MSRPSVVVPRPYRMRNQIQHYAWGTRDAEAFIPRLLGQDPEPGLPYAELWLGTHPNAPSEVELDDGVTARLDTWIASHPSPTLGIEVMRRFGALPFLLKVLSAGEALSIQAHPSRTQAAALHAADPVHYPDDNHKPEVAIALDGLAALVGFKPFHELSATLQHYPEIATFIGGPATELVAGSENPAPDVSSRLTHALFAALIRRALEEPNALATTVDALAQRLSANVGGLTETELWFLELCQQYGNRDVGVFTLFLLNLVHLRPGEGIFTNAGVPHAYLRGNIVECMANSDNVVRVGLTPKYKDAETLLRIADTTPQQPQILEGDACTLREGVTAATYRTPAPEFEVRRWRLAPGTEHILDKGSGPAILLVTAGAVELAWDGGHADYRQGDSAFLPACLAECTVHAKDDSELFLARVPEGRR